jgi:hypothetical protein
VEGRPRPRAGRLTLAGSRTSAGVVTAGVCRGAQVACRSPNRTVRTSSSAPPVRPVAECPAQHRPASSPASTGYAPALSHSFVFAKFCWILSSTSVCRAGLAPNHLPYPQ